MIDHTIMNDMLCNWLEEELELTELSEDLRELLEKHSSIEYFVLSILNFSAIYTQLEMNQIKRVLEKSRNQKDVEKQKYKADNLFENGAVEESILIYQSILNEAKDETVGEEFYGKLYGCLGAAYGRLFLYEEAMKMYDKAFQICSDPTMLEAYIYAAFKALPQEEYHLFLEKSEIFQGLHIKIQEELQSVIDQMEKKKEPKEELVENWKNEYRKRHL